TPSPTGRIAQALRSARRSDYLPPVIVLAVAALLLIMFLLGFLAGRPARAQQPPTGSNGVTTTSPAGQTPAPAPVPNQPAQPAAARVTINPVPGQDQQVWSFFKAATYFPQSPCSRVEDTVWQCTKRGEPPPGDQSVLVAVPVPLSEVSTLQA